MIAICRSAWSWVTLCGILWSVGSFVPHAPAMDLDEAERLLLHGEHVACIAEARKAIDNHVWNERWRHLLLRAQLETGRYREALPTAEKALEQYPSSVEVRRLAYSAYLLNGQSSKAAELLKGLDSLHEKYGAWRYKDPRSLVSWGRLLGLRKADPKEILEQYYGRAKKADASFLPAYFASAELALEKKDAALAVELLEPAVKLAPEHPELNHLLARAYASSDPVRSEEARQRALSVNPRHVGCLMLAIDKLIDAEQFGEARKQLKKVLAVNPRQWQAHAYYAVLSHLDGNDEDEKFWRNKGLEDWTDNPGVDHLIGRKLSQQYRFAEGAEYQRSALARQSEYQPARIQLAQDLLRLGKEDEGWTLAESVSRDDPYHVVAHNLMILRDNLGRFRTLRAEGLVVKMDSGEADIYGQEVLALLASARKTLTARYQVSLPDPIHVEIFPQQADFAIRTFGLPGGAGYLGVCFGNVITANSPASQGEHPANWRSVLWHEFCHVVTLHKTKNRMPRWLSEGISVYEERRHNKAWGKSMNAVYRQMILDGQATPLSQLSSAFLAPPGPLHLEFAYFESSLVVDFLIQEFEFETVLKILDDLAAGMPVNESLTRHTRPLDVLDVEFAAFLQARAKGLAPRADWSRVSVALGPESTVAEQRAAWDEAVRNHPLNILALKQLSKHLLKQREFAQALGPLQKLLEIFPEDVGTDCAYRLLAKTHRELKDAARERTFLEQLVARDADAVSERLRLVDLCTRQEDWNSVAGYSEQLLAINPLNPGPHRSLAAAAEHLDDAARSVRAYGSLVHMDPVDPADVHWRLARALLAQNELKRAKRQVLKALEEAPRFEAAHQTLLEIVGRSGPNSPPAHRASPKKNPPSPTGSENGRDPDEPDAQTNRGSPKRETRFSRQGADYE